MIFSQLVLLYFILPATSTRHVKSLVDSRGGGTQLCAKWAKKDSSTVDDIVSIVSAVSVAANTLIDAYDAYQTAAVTAADKKMAAPSLRDANAMFEKKGGFFLPRCFKGRVPTNANAIYDGDTFTMIAHNAPDASKSYKWRVRLRGCDCPELSGSTKSERRWAIVAREHVVSLIEGEVVTLDKIGYDKYGRVLANVEVNGVDLASSLLKAKLAVPYDGRTKSKVNWKELCSKGKRVDPRIDRIVTEYEERRKVTKPKPSSKTKIGFGGGFWGMFYK